MKYASFCRIVTWFVISGFILLHIDFPWFQRNRTDVKTFVSKVVLSSLVLLDGECVENACKQFEKCFFLFNSTTFCWLKLHWFIITFSSFFFGHSTEWSRASISFLFLQQLLFFCHCIYFYKFLFLFALLSQFQLTNDTEQATDASLASENWALNMEICDMINESSDAARDAMKAIRKRLSQNAGKNYTVIMYTLTVLETCVKNCGKAFHVLVANKEFIQDLVKLIGPKNDPPAVVQEKVLNLIQIWADAFRSQPDLNGVVQVYQELKSKGIEFPVADLDAMAPIYTPQRVCIIWCRFGLDESTRTWIKWTFFSIRFSFVFST